MTFNIDSEKKFWNWLRTKIPGHVVRIENSIASGLPDVNWCYRGVEMWIELKYGHEVLLRRGQYAWGMRRTKAGGRVYIVNYCPIHDGVSLFCYPLSVEKKGEYLLVTSAPAWNYPRTNITELII